jgi:hypothetical protein
MILFYPLIALAVLAGWVGPWVLLPRWPSHRWFACCVSTTAQAGRAAGLVPARGWPLWFVGFAFRHVRLAGGLLTLGLLLTCSCR